jgi:hypothetical protein
MSNRNHRVLVASRGKVMSAVQRMKLHSEITRMGGSAKLVMKNNCAVAVGASSMLPVAVAACSKPNILACDDRTDSADQNSAFRCHSGAGSGFGVYALAYEEQ